MIFTMVIEEQALFVLQKDKNIESVLTPRETEYLGLVAMGFKNYEIANILSVTISTVKKTLETIFDKLNAVDRANAVSIAFVHKLLDDVVLSQISNKYNTQDYKTL